MATAIFFGGRRINIPGAYSQFDTSGLAAVSPAAVGIVALVGTAEGGKPLSVDSTDSDHTRSDTLDERYRSGDLRTAGKFCFDPANDDAVPGGAQRLVCVKVNPSTQSSGTFNDSLAAAAMVVTSIDYGLFTTQINISIAAGSTLGKKITVVFETTSEVFDDVGGTSILDVDYTPGVVGYTAATGQVTTTDFRGAGTKASAGLDSERTADIPVTGTIQVVSSNAGDVGQTVKVYGLLAGSIPTSETLILNGVTPVIGTTLFLSVLGVVKSAVTAGTVAVKDNVIPTTLFSLAAGVLTRGLVVMTNAPIVPASSTIAIDVGSAGANAMVVTTDSAGAEVLQRIDLATNASFALTGTGIKVKYLVYGDVPAARTVTLSARMFTFLFSSYTTVQKVVDALNMLDGIDANANVDNPTTFLMTDMDRAAATSILSVVRDFYADLFAVIDTINTSSDLVTAERSDSPNGNLVPANTVAPTYLTGGIEGVTTINEWTSAFTLLKKRRVNTIVPLTNDPAVHALLLTHLRLRAGQLRSESNGYVGIGTNAGAGETRANIKAQIVALQYRQISALSQEMNRFDPDTGEATWYPPYFFAAQAAGMQAGSAIAEPLTHKKPNVLDIRQDTSWTVEDDSEEMIDAGLMFAEKIDDVGIRFVRSVTTHIADDNPIYTEMSSNESADQFAYQFRRVMEQRVGRRGVSGSVGAVKGLAQGAAETLVTDQIIVAFRALQVEQIGDVFPISIEVAPVEPENFFPITIHLVRTRAAA